MFTLSLTFYTNKKYPEKKAFYIQMKDINRHIFHSRFLKYCDDVLVFLSRILIIEGNITNYALYLTIYSVGIWKLH